MLYSATLLRPECFQRCTASWSWSEEGWQSALWHLGQPWGDQADIAKRYGVAHERRIRKAHSTGRRPRRRGPRSRLERERGGGEGEYPDRSHLVCSSKDTQHRETFPAKWCSGLFVAGYQLSPVFGWIRPRMVCPDFDRLRSHVRPMRY